VRSPLQTDIIIASHYCGDSSCLLPVLYASNSPVLLKFDQCLAIHNSYTRVSNRHNLKGTRLSCQWSVCVLVFQCAK
jgi:hypothetical protein